MAAGASGFQLAPAWLPHSKDGGSRQGRGAFISTLDRLPLALLILDYNGFWQLCLLAVLHVLIITDVRHTIFVLKRSRTKRIDVALIVPQDALHGQRITGTGRFDRIHG